MLVDAHAHVLPRDYPPDAPECFPRMEPVDGSTDRTLVFGAMKFRARDAFFAAERRLEAAAASGVDAEVLTPMPPLLRYDLPAADGLALARHVNEFTAQMCSADPARLIGLGMVAMQDPDAAAAELAALAGLGLRGVEIASNILDTPIGDERFLPFFAEAERLGLADLRARDARPPPRPTRGAPAGRGPGHVRGRRGGRAGGRVPGHRRHRGQVPGAADLVQPRRRRVPADAAPGAVLLERGLERGARGARARDHA